MSPHNPHHRRRASARRTEAALAWIGYAADAAGVMCMTGWAHGSAIATVVGVGAAAGSRTALWWQLVSITPTIPTTRRAERAATWWWHSVRMLRDARVG